MQVPLEAEASTSKSFLTDGWEGGGGGTGDNQKSNTKASDPT